MTVKRRRPPDHFNDPLMPWTELGDLPAVPDSELRALIPSGTDAGQIDEFMLICRRGVQMALLQRGREPAAGCAARLRAVETKCHALVTALLELRADDQRELGHVIDGLANGIATADLSEAMRAAVDSITHRDGIHRMGPGCLVAAARLNILFDAAQDVETLAERAADSVQARVSRHARPRIEAARELAGVAVYAHRHAFASLPAVGDSWFQAFVARLGESCGITCGAEATNAQINLYRREAKRATSG